MVRQVCGDIEITVNTQALRDCLSLGAKWGLKMCLFAVMGVFMLFAGCAIVSFAFGEYIATLEHKL